MPERLAGSLGFGQRHIGIVRVPMFVTSLLLASHSSRWAHAESTTSDRAIAEKLYERGRQQMTAGNVGSACESFAESFRLDPATGTMLNLAVCHQAAERLASAWVEFREVAVASRREGRAERMRFAQEHILEIEPKLAHLTIGVSESLEGQGPVVTLDGRQLGPPAWGVPIPIDQGWHEVVAQRPGRPPWRFALSIRDAESRVVMIPHATTEPAVASAPHAETVTATTLAISERQPAGESKASGPSGRRVGAIASFGVGVAAIGVGTYFGLRAANLWEERNQYCPNEVCSDRGTNAGKRAGSAATVATWTIGGGVVAMGLAAWLFLSTPHSAKAITSRTAMSHISLGIEPRGSLFMRAVF